MKPKWTIGKEPNQIVLADECDRCNGTGLIDIGAAPYMPKHVGCDSCDGFGFLNTEDGAAILALVAETLMYTRKSKS